MAAGRAILRAAAFWLILIGPSAAELAVPAELPPEDYAGQQYVDSTGCLFLRAGPEENETWIPRVTRDGVPICGYPPSGRRVPVAEGESETGMDPDTAP
jgi:hypothetical protein